MILIWVLKRWNLCQFSARVIQIISLVMPIPKVVYKIAVALETSSVWTGRAERTKSSKTKSVTSWWPLSRLWQWMVSNFWDETTPQSDKVRWSSGSVIAGAHVWPSSHKRVAIRKSRRNRWIKFLQQLYLKLLKHPRILLLRPPVQNTLGRAVAAGSTGRWKLLSSTTRFLSKVTEMCKKYIACAASQ